MNPKDLKYTSTHEWVRLEGGTATVGITEHAAHALSDLVYLGLPSVGDKIAVGKSFGEIESVKAVSDLNAPVDGEVVEVNAALSDDLPTIIDAQAGAFGRIGERRQESEGVGGGACRSAHAPQGGQQDKRPEARAIGRNRSGDSAHGSSPSQDRCSNSL